MKNSSGLLFIMAFCVLLAWLGIQGVGENQNGWRLYDWDGKNKDLGLGCLEITRSQQQQQQTRGETIVSKFGPFYESDGTEYYIGGKIIAKDGDNYLFISDVTGHKTWWNYREDIKPLQKYDKNGEIRKGWEPNSYDD